MADKEFKRGDWVVYMPGVAEGNCLHPACERGVVSSVGSGGHVFVFYGQQNFSKATYPEDLVTAEEYFAALNGSRRSERQPPLDGFRTYIGDGLYANFDGFNVVLSAENGMHSTDTVYLEPRVFEALNTWHVRRIAPLFQSVEG